MTVLGKWRAQDQLFDAPSVGVYHFKSIGRTLLLGRNSSATGRTIVHNSCEAYDDEHETTRW